MFLDDIELRIIVALGLRLIATERVPEDDRAFDEYVHELAVRAAAALRTQGLHAAPLFPGTPLRQAAVSSGVRRAVFVADLWREDELVGTAITSLIRGRLPNINVAPPIEPVTQPR